MNKPNLLLITALVFVAVVAAAELLVPRIAVGSSHYLPVASFPRTIAGWTAGPDRPVDPDLQARLAHAHIVERVYKNQTGGSVDLLLLTSDNLEDFHDPQICMLSQGWSVERTGPVDIDNQQATYITAGNGDRSVKTVYWLLGDYARLKANTPLLKTLHGVRHAVVRRDEGTCLFVRMIANNNAAGDRALKQFVHDTRPAIESLAPSNLRLISKPVQI